jgi:glycerate 2-kinase
MPSLDAAQQRQLLRTMYDKAVSVAHPQTCVPANLPEIPAGGRLIIVGAGKAAAAMARATEGHYLAKGQAGQILGFVTTRHGYGLPTTVIPVMEAGHPVPDANSISSAALAVQLAKSAGPNDLVLCLLSGGVVRSQTRTNKAAPQIRRAHF